MSSAERAPQRAGDDGSEETERHKLRVRLVDAIHEQCRSLKTRCVLYIAGGAALASGWLLGRPGASSWIVEVRVPYGRNSLRELFLPDKLPGTFTSKETSVSLANFACKRAQRLGEESVGSLEPIRYLGLGFTGALSSHEPKKGGSRCFLSTARETGETLCKSVKLENFGRDKEEVITSELVLLSIAESLGVSTALTARGLIELTEVSGKATLESFYDDPSMSHILWRPNGLSLVPRPQFAGIIIPGSFNPVHRGHVELALAVQKKFPDLPVAFEITISNADKGYLDINELKKRLSCFTEHPVIITKATRFFEKAELLPGCVFAVGADTAVRIVDNKYYESEEAKYAGVAHFIYALGCRFVVGGRVDAKTGAFTTCESEVRAALPSQMVDRGFSFISESEFRVDISSTELRNSGKGLL